METLIPILACILCLLSGIWIGKITTKNQKHKIGGKVIKEKIVGEEIKDAPIFSNQIHPLVQLIYKEFISENVKYFHIEHCTLRIKHLDIDIWSANDVWSREFREVSIDLLKEHNLTLKELNNILTMADKKILDRIVKAVEVNNKEFISRIFI